MVLNSGYLWYGKVGGLGLCRLLATGRGAASDTSLTSLEKRRLLGTPTDPT